MILLRFTMKISLTKLLSTLAIPLTVSSLHAESRVIADFENPKLPEWQATGEAFQNGASKRDLDAPDQRIHSTIKGDYAINSGSLGDHTQAPSPRQTSPSIASS